MSICYSNKFKNGLKILFNKEPFSVEKTEFVNPGKGRSFVRTKLKRLRTGQIIDKTFKSTDVLCIANVNDIFVIYLYCDKETCYFMNIKNFEQLSLKKNDMNNCFQWLVNGEKYFATEWNNKLITVVPNNFVSLKVIDVQPSIKGDVVNSGNKFVKLSTGIILKVPLFIQKNDLLKINTRSGEYVSRIKQC